VIFRPLNYVILRDSRSFYKAIYRADLLFNEYQRQFHQCQVPQCEADLSPPTAAEVKKQWS
jgi:hypothetical protein